jgi:hypothetical protein
MSGAPGLPHQHVRDFLRSELNPWIFTTSYLDERRSDDTARKVYELLELPVPDPIPPILTDIDAALGLVPILWWWDISHLEVSIIPTVPHDNIPIANARLYDSDGRPVGYHTMYERDIRQGIAAAICASMLKIKYDLPTAYGVRASMREEAAKVSKFTIP